MSARSTAVAALALALAGCATVSKPLQGEFTAIFDGTHGWFWRNRSTRDVSVTLRTTGEYARVIRP